LLISTLIAIIASGTNSPASSLGPSDSASQQPRADSQLKADLQSKANAQLIEELLSRVEPLLMCPDFISEAVLWDYEDCANDPAGGNYPHRS
jgi:hypothetical protein